MLKDYSPNYIPDGSDDDQSYSDCSAPEGSEGLSKSDAVPANYEEAAPPKMKEASSKAPSSRSPSFLKVQDKSPLQALQHLINRQRTKSSDELEL